MRQPTHLYTYKKSLTDKQEVPTTKCKEDEEGKTREILGSMGINLDTACEMCGQATKSISHVFSVRTYVSHLLGTYVTILYNWFIL